MAKIRTSEPLCEHFPPLQLLTILNEKPSVNVWVTGPSKTRTPTSFLMMKCMTATSLLIEAAFGFPTNAIMEFLFSDWFCHLLLSRRRHIKTRFEGLCRLRNKIVLILLDDIQIGMIARISFRWANAPFPCQQMQ